MTTATPKATIHPDKTLFIRLGTGGHWAEECIRENVVKLSFKSVPHDICARKDWDAVREVYAEQSQGAVSNFINQLRLFYETDENILWITFHDNKLWWCFAKAEVEPMPDGTRIRRVLGQWESTTIQGTPLTLDTLSSFLTSVQNFRGTVCTLSEEKHRYLINRVNHETPLEIQRSVDSLQALRESLEGLLAFIDQKDMEVLVDLILRHSGWQRISKVGETMKGFDLILTSPLKGEKIGVQVKTRARKAEFNEFFQFSRNLQEFDEFYFVAHTLDFDPEKYFRAPENQDAWADKERYYFMDASMLAQHVIDAGLTQWVIERAALSR